MNEKNIFFSLLKQHLLYFYEFLTIIRCLNYKRILNLIKLFILPKKNTINFLPFAITIETSSICQLNCPECLRGMNKVKRKKNFFDINSFQNIIDNLKSFSFYLNLYFQGEPFLNPSISTFIKIATEYKYFTVIATNGQDLNEEKIREIIKYRLSKIIFSLDGFTQETYSKYRKNGNIEKIINNILLLEKIKKQIKSKLPIIEIQFLINKYNEDDLTYIKKWALQHNFMFKVKTIQIYNNVDLLPKSKKYSRYYIINDSLVTKKRKKKCNRIYTNIVITSDGDVVLCCQDKIPAYIIGNVKNNFVTDIWTSKVFNSYRSDVSKNKIILCKNCGI